jgi:hypothetical protein
MGATEHVHADVSGLGSLAGQQKGHGRSADGAARQQTMHAGGQEAPQLARTLTYLDSKLPELFKPGILDAGSCQAEMQDEACAKAAGSVQVSIGAQYCCSQ